MKKSVLLLLILLLLPAHAQAEPSAPFSIDEIHAYSSMARSYAQGYAPTVSGDALTLVLPLLSDAASGEITARIAIDDPDVSPVKAASWSKNFSRKTYTFGREKISAYLVTAKLPLHRDRVNGEYPLSVTVSGADEAGNPLEQRFDFTFTVTDGRANADAPQLIVSGFTPSAEFLTAGEAAEIQLTLTNASRNQAIRAVSLTVSDSKEEILPVASDTHRVESLAAGESVTLPLSMRVTRKAAEGPHTLSVAMRYTYDGASARAEATEKFCVDVRQTVRMEYTEPQLAARLTEGDVVSLPVTLMNTGRSQLSNALICVDLPGVASGGSVLAGDVAPGESKSVSANLRVTGETLGDVRGTLFIRYEDAYGDAHEQAIPLVTAIDEKIVPAAVAAIEEPQGLNQPVIQYVCIGIAALCLLALAVQGAYYRKKLRHLEEQRL